MKKTMVSLAVASLVATSAMAADKGVDLTVSGQTVVYTQTSDKNDNTLGSSEASVANLGVQLNVGGDLGNGFTLGTQFSHLSTSGLAFNVVDNVAQNSEITGQSGSDLMVTQVNIAKVVGNTTVKLGRQELPKSLSPLAFSEGWNVFKNTFDAALVINSDLPSTTLVLAAVDTSNSSKNLTSRGKLQAAGATVDGAYMLTAQTTLLPLTTVTASYYALGTVAAGLATDDTASAVWIDAKVADKSLPMGLKIGLQGGQIAPADSNLEATTAMGVKVGLAPVDGLNICVAYTSVDDGTVAVKNTGTGVKTPLYTQMVLNQNYIALDNTTMMVSGAYDLGDAGKVIARGSFTTAGDTAASKDYTDLELLYKVKAGGINVLAALVQTTEEDMDAVNTVRVWGRYAF